MNANFALQDLFLGSFFKDHWLTSSTLPWDEIKPYFQTLAQDLLAKIKPD